MSEALETGEEGAGPLGVPLLGVGKAGHPPRSPSAAQNMFSSQEKARPDFLGNILVHLKRYKSLSLMSARFPGQKAPFSLLQMAPIFPLKMARLPGAQLLSRPCSRDVLSQTFLSMWPSKALLPPRPASFCSTLTSVLQTLPHMIAKTPVSSQDSLLTPPTNMGASPPQRSLSPATSPPGPPPPQGHLPPRPTSLGRGCAFSVSRPHPVPRDGSGSWEPGSSTPVSCRVYLQLFS